MRLQLCQNSIENFSKSICICGVVRGGHLSNIYLMIQFLTNKFLKSKPKKPAQFERPIIWEQISIHLALITLIFFEKPSHYAMVPLLYIECTLSPWNNYTKHIDYSNNEALF